MFCKFCGESNNNFNKYCTHDGRTLNGDNNIKNKLTGDNKKFCKVCGSGGKEESLYCTNCGNSSFEIQKGKKDFSLNLDGIKAPKISLPKDLVNSKFNIVKAGIYGFIGFIGVMLVSIFLSMSISDMIYSFLYEFDALDILKDMNLELLEFWDVVLLSNAIPIKMTSNFAGNNMSLKVRVGILGLVAIPCIIFFVLGFVKASRDLSEDQDVNIVENLLIGVIYGIIIFFVSVVYKTTLTIQIFYRDIMTKSYMPYDAFINGFLIATIMLFTGYALKRILNKKDMKYYINDIAKGVLFFIVMLMLTTIGTFFGVLSSGDILDATLMLIVQASAYILGFVNFGVLNLGVIGDLDKYALFNDMMDNPSIWANNIGNIERILLMILILIPIVVFFLYSIRNRKYKEKKVFIFPLAYSIMMFLCMNIIRIMVEVPKNSYDILNLGLFMNSGGVFINTLLLSCAATLIGYLFAKGRDTDE